MNSMDLLTEPPDLGAILEAQSRAKRFQAYAIICLSAVLLALAVIVGLATWSNHDTSRSNGARIDNLTSQLSEAQQQLTQRANSDLIRTACAARLTSNVNRAAYNAAAAEDQLVIALATTTAEERATALPPLVTALTDAVTAYDDAVTLEASYTVDVPDEPCPLDVAQSG